MKRCCRSHCIRYFVNLTSSLRSSINHRVWISSQLSLDTPFLSAQTFSPLSRGGLLPIPTISSQLLFSFISASTLSYQVRYAHSWDVTGWVSRDMWSQCTEVMKRAVGIYKSKEGHLLQKITQILTRYRPLDNISMKRESTFVPHSMKQYSE